MDIGLGLDWASEILAVLSIGLALTLFWIARRTKHLDYRVLGSSPLARDVLGDPWSRHIKVEVEGRPVDDPHLVAIALRNTGRTPIASADFAACLRIATGGSILAHRVTYRQPSNLEATLERGGKDDELLLMPLLLNPGDFFVLEAIMEGDADPRLHGRIAGVRDIRRMRDAPQGVVQKLLDFFAKYTSASDANWIVAAILGWLGVAVFHAFVAIGSWLGASLSD